jgi:hypothetical protein
MYFIVACVCEVSVRVVCIFRGACFRCVQVWCRMVEDRILNNKNFNPDREASASLRRVIS